MEVKEPLLSCEDMDEIEAMWEPPEAQPSGRAGAIDEAFDVVQDGAARLAE